MRGKIRKSIPRTSSVQFIVIFIIILVDIDHKISTSDAERCVFYLLSFYRDEEGLSSAIIAFKVAITYEFSFFNIFGHKFVENAILLSMTHQPLNFYVRLKPFY